MIRGFRYHPVYDGKTNDFEILWKLVKISVNVDVIKVSDESLRLDETSCVKLAMFHKNSKVMQAL